MTSVRVLRLAQPLMRGPDVRALQTRLAKLGYHPGIGDGVYGTRTAAAVKAAKKAWGLTPVDGSAGARFQTMLEHKTNKPPAPAGPPAPRPLPAWLTRVGRYTVERHPCPHPGQRVDPARPRAGVMHTTQGSLESGLSVFEQHFAPHFLVGTDKTHATRVLQLIPLGEMAAALENHPGGVETNAWALAQIEVADFSQQQPWIFDPHTLDAVAELLAALRQTAGIPLTRPFADTMPPRPWATEAFARRHAGHWGKTAGWYGHVEIPENSHWDPGALRWSTLLSLAATKLT